MDITIKVTIAAVILLLLIIFKIKYDEKKYKERLINRLKNTWGVPSNRDYTPELMKNIKYYYKQTSGENDVDDITCNDIDLDCVYKKINHTCTSIGEEYLYALLRKPITDEKELQERERIIQIMSDNPEERLKLQLALSQMGKPGKISVYQYLQEIKDIKCDSQLKHIICAILPVASVGLCFLLPDIMILITIVIFAYNIISYYKSKAGINAYIQLFGFIVRTVRQSKDIAKQKISGIEEYQEKLKECAEKFDKFCKNSYLVSGGSQMGGDILDSLADYIRMIFHIDLIKICSMAKEAAKYENELFEIYEIIGYIDSMVSIASYRQSLEYYCVPELLHSDSGKSHDIFIECNELYHPLIDEPVKNSIKTNRCVLLTGSNASGKSTFIKTVALNAIMAQTIHTVLAKNYRSSYYYIYSSMALRDDLFSNESYYIVEIKSLKRILDKVKSSSVPVLCFIDEVLRGTNTLERIASSSEILAKLSKLGAMCFAATHDIELTSILEEYFSNYHFEEHVDDNDVLFDYKLRKGKANTRNAIKLLKMIGYDDDITYNAENHAINFLDTGVWNKI